MQICLRLPSPPLADHEDWKDEYVNKGEDDHGSQARIRVLEGAVRELEAELEAEEGACVCFDGGVEFGVGLILLILLLPPSLPSLSRTRPPSPRALRMTAQMQSERETQRGWEMQEGQASTYEKTEEERARKESKSKKGMSLSLSLVRAWTWMRLLVPDMRVDVDVNMDVDAPSGPDAEHDEATNARTVDGDVREDTPDAVKLVESDAPCALISLASPVLASIAFPTTDADSTLRSVLSLPPVLAPRPHPHRVSCFRRGPGHRLEATRTTLFTLPHPSPPPLRFPPLTRSRRHADLPHLAPSPPHQHPRKHTRSSQTSPPPARATRALQIAFREYHLALQETCALSSSVSSRLRRTPRPTSTHTPPTYTTPPRDVLCLAVERLYDWTEDARVELETRVADGRVLVRGWEAIGALELASGGGQLEGEEGEPEEGGGGIEDVRRHLARDVEAQASFPSKLDDVEHDIAVLKRVVYAPLLEDAGPSSSPAAAPLPTLVKAEG
ncbi:hypothetical protein B0H12DRAFT_1329097 [Mycena haematopus]|nr:hypothetical protein B0H12DRAFT_1329097 [Mycena haematopus]